MSHDWCPGIRQACSHWRDAPMLQHTFASLETALAEENDACIDCSKAIVEVVCRVIVDELDSPVNPVKPQTATPNFGEWVGAAVRVLKLGNNPDKRFLKLVSQHHKLTTALGSLRNDAGPVSHGRDGFLEVLSVHHRRAAVLSADALVAFLHQAYIESEKNLARTREPYERFTEQHQLIDDNVSISASVDEEGFLICDIALPSGDVIPQRVEASRLLYLLDRDGYIEALRAVRDVALVPSDNDSEGDD